MKYTIKRTIAKNKSALILLAQTDLKEDSYEVIIKAVIPEINDKIYAQLYLAKQLNHPRIHQLIDFGKCRLHSENRNFVVYKNIPGTALSTILQKLRQNGLETPIPFIVDIAISLCDILTYSHNFFKSGHNEFIPHGNLSPGFIQISPAGYISIADMGIGNIVSYRFETTDLVENTSGPFIHPDISKGKMWKRKHEIFSLGKIIMYMLEENIEREADKKIVSRIEKKSGKNFAGRIDLIKIAKQLLTNQSTSIQEIKQMLIDYTKEYHIYFNNDLTAQIVRSLICDFESPVNNPEGISTDNWIIHDFAQNQPYCIFEDHTKYNDNLSDYTTETDTFGFYDPILKITPSLKSIPDLIQNQSEVPIKQIEPVLENDCFNSLLLNRSNNEDHAYKNPFLNLIKKEDHTWLL